MKKVLFILNHAPNYRDVFLQELAKHVDLTVMSRRGSEIGLKDPERRVGYNYIQLKERRLFGINFNLSQFTYALGNFDVLILGASLREPFMLLNLFSSKKKILFGHIFGHNAKKESFVKKIFNKWAWNHCDSFLVHTDFIKSRLQKETGKSIYSFNNTYFTQSEIKKMPFNDTTDGLNIIWIGRYRKEKYRLRNVTYLMDIAKRNPNVTVRLIGAGMKDAFVNKKLPSNIELYGEIFDNAALENHYRWSHVVMNPGIVGLLVMNTARFGRPLIIDENSVQGPEVQLAIDSNQLFIDFDNREEVDNLIASLVNDGKKRLEKWGNDIAEVMKEKYTLEYMLSQFLQAIND